ncbi:MAG: trigger factor, partial [Patescibacteria group bacterium]|nr:trigger factor [Patescibacteria group bacterium]
AKLTWLPKKTYELEFSIPWQEVKISYDKTLDQLTKKSKIEGFRPGKAPKNLVEKSIDKGKLYGEVINQLLPLSYAQAITQHKLRPAIAPKITIISAEENKPWQFKAAGCELPEVKLGNYQGIARSALVKSQLEKKELDKTQKLNLISKALIDEIKIELSDLIIDSERDRLLSRLLEQIQKLGLTIDQYAASNNKTVDQIKQEYQLTAANTLKLELILQAIAEAKKFKTETKDIDAMINASGDEKIKKQLNTSSERAYIDTLLKKRQAIDYLLSL